MSYCWKFQRLHFPILVDFLDMHMCHQITITIAHVDTAKSTGLKDWLTTMLKNLQCMAVSR